MNGKIKLTVNQQKKFFESGRTKEYRFRLQALRRLSRALKEYEKELELALKKDLNKSSFESYMTEIGLTLSELGFAIRHLKSWMQTKRAAASIGQLPGECFILPEPYGTVFIMAPWNYPLLLCLEPLIGALAAGNCVVLKPSAYAPAVSSILKKMLGSIYPEKYVAVVEGGREANSELLEQRFDYIFFTGGVDAGRLVLEKAARHLTPVTLELGGKSPCIVDDSANIRMAARRIAFGKLLNAGQTCVAPDYVAVHEDVAGQLVSCLRTEIEKMIGSSALENPDYPKIINRKHFDRIQLLMEGEEISYGGQADENTLKIAPTILTGIKPESAVMQEEIFGPVLPVITWRTREELKELITSFEKPLAFYLFTRSRKMAEWAMNTFSFGGGCINDTVIHLASPHMPFGGVGKSGMGNYHGKAGFETFSHNRSVVRQKYYADFPLRYHPYSPWKDKLLRRILK